MKMLSIKFLFKFTLICIWSFITIHVGLPKYDVLVGRDLLDITLQFIPPAMLLIAVENYIRLLKSNKFSCPENKQSASTLSLGFVALLAILNIIQYSINIHFNGHSFQSLVLLYALNPYYIYHSMFMTIKFDLLKKRNKPNKDSHR